MVTESSDWLGDKWFVSPYNFSPEVRSSLELPNDVQIYDVTLRDGEQCAGVVFTKDDKVRIARALDEVGVHRIEAGMPVVSEQDYQAVKEIANLGLQTKVKSFCRATRSDIDTSLKAGVWGVVIELPSSKHLIETGYQWNEEKVVEMAVDAGQYAKSHGLHTTFFCIDSTRADQDFLRGLYTTVVEQAKVDAIALVDTFGVASPWALAHLVKKVRSWVDVPIEVHVHNDLGLATANSISAITAGASVIHTNVNGLGERSGGAALEEVVMALKLLLGVDMGMKTEGLVKLSKTIQEISRVDVHAYKPVVGDQSFSYEAGIAVMFSKRFTEANYLQGALPYLPEMVGNEFNIVVGKKSGKHSIEWKAKDLGIPLKQGDVDKILDKVKQESIRKKSAINDEELKRIMLESY